MRVRINNGADMFWTMDRDVKPLETTTDLIVAVDPSKSNMAVMIGTVAGVELRILEFSGNDKNVLAETMDTTDFGLEVMAYLRKLLANHTVRLFGIEKHILKKGMEYYNSMTVLTEIRTHLINLAVELTGSKPWEVNNSAWKGTILPDGYRGHKEKGSKRFIHEREPKYSGYSDDATDVICIYRYMMKKWNGNIGIIKCSAVEEIITPVSLMLISDRFVVPEARMFEYNPGFTLEQNAIYFANRSSVTGYSVVPVELLTYDEIYKYARMCIPGYQTVLYVIK